MGPAVDEAAAMNDLAQGAFIWLLPSALEVFMSPAEALASQPAHVATYSACEVPLKGGDSFVTYAVSPVALANTQADRDEIVSRIMQTFAGMELDVQIKKQNTLRFLDTCVAKWKPPTTQPEEVG